MGYLISIQFVENEKNDAIIEEKGKKVKEIKLNYFTKKCPLLL